MSADSTAAANADSLLKTFYDLLTKYDKLAVRAKRRYNSVWLLIAVSTFLTFCAAIMGAVMSEPSWLGQFVLYWGIPTLSVFSGGLTIVQTLLRLRPRWWRYRAGAENLEAECIRYRYRLPPYDGETAEHELRRRIGEIQRQVEQAGDRLLRPGDLWDLLVGSRKAPDPWDRLPYSPTLAPFQGVVDGERPFLERRLRHREQWYLARARIYLWAYLTFHGLLLAFNAASAVIALALGRYFLAIALFTAINLFMIAVRRNYVDAGLFLMPYVVAARRLKDLEERYLNNKMPFDRGTQDERFRELVDRVEGILRTELESWTDAHEPKV